MESITNAKNECEYIVTSKCSKISVFNGWYLIRVQTNYILEILLSGSSLSSLSLSSASASSGMAAHKDKHTCILLLTPNFETQAIEQ